jgi:hypothetical protein
MLVLGVLLCVWCFAMPDQVLRTWSGGMANGTRRIVGVDDLIDSTKVALISLGNIGHPSL